jgi:hypothetical protein
LEIAYTLLKETERAERWLRSAPAPADIYPTSNGKSGARRRSVRDEVEFEQV